ncbi:hypothetical protein BKA80DRAFT_272428 [Phyllosticta citrichinensis]
MQNHQIDRPRNCQNHLQHPQLNSTRKGMQTPFPYAPKHWTQRKQHQAQPRPQRQSQAREHDLKSPQNRQPGPSPRPWPRSQSETPHRRAQPSSDEKTNPKTNNPRHQTPPATSTPRTPPRRNWRSAPNSTTLAMKSIAGWLRPARAASWRARRSRPRRVRGGSASARRSCRRRQKKRRAT